MTNKSLEIEIQILKNQLEKIQKEQHINYMSHPNVYCPATVHKQSAVYANRRASLLPITTPARNNILLPDRLGTMKRNPQVILSRLQCPSVYPDRTVRMSSYVPVTSKKSVYAPRKRMTRENAIPQYQKNDCRVSTYFPNPLAPKNY